MPGGDAGPADLHQGVGVQAGGDPGQWLVRAGHHLHAVSAAGRASSAFTGTASTLAARCEVMFTFTGA